MSRKTEPEPQKSTKKKKKTQAVSNLHFLTTQNYEIGDYNVSFNYSFNFVAFLDLFATIVQKLIKKKKPHIQKFTDYILRN